MTKQQATVQIEATADNPFYDWIYVTDDATGKRVSSAKRQFRQEDPTSTISRVCDEAEDRGYIVKLPDNLVFGE